MKSKLMLTVMVLTVAMFAASTAFATIELSSRSEEMVANSTCDQAGSIELAFDEDDYTLISAYLVSNDYVRIRVTLTGTDIEASATPPFLCEAITGTASDSYDVDDLPVISTDGDDYVAIDMEGVEVSDFSGGADLMAFVYGKEGNRYFDIFIVGMLDPSTIGSPDDKSWIRIGLYDELKEVYEFEDDTAICVNVEDFSGLSKLTASYNFTPTSLSINSSDNEIGHFLETVYTLRNLNDKYDCTKGPYSIEDDDEIPIDCPEEMGPPPGQDEEEVEECPYTVNGSYYKYLVMEGDYPADGAFTLVVRSNGAADEDNTQSGVYISSVAIYNVFQDECGPYSAYTGSGMSTTMYDADGDPAEDIDDDGPCEFYNTEKIVVDGIPTDGIAAYGNKVIIRISYFVLEEMVDVGDEVSFWVEAMTEPCGAMGSGSFAAADITQCVPSLEDCMYFPYVLTGASPWATGVVITNLQAHQGGPDGVSIPSMYAIVTLVDSTGTAFEYEMSFTSAVTSFVVDNLVSTAGWTPAAGNCWLQVETNFTADGYSFLTNGVFGAGTLPRQSCCETECTYCEEYKY